MHLYSPSFPCCFGSIGEMGHLDEKVKTELPLAGKERKNKSDPFCPDRPGKRRKKEITAKCNLVGLQLPQGIFRLAGPLTGAQSDGDHELLHHYSGFPIVRFELTQI